MSVNLDIKKIACRFKELQPSTVIRSRACPHCPSMAGTDPESEDMLTFPRSFQLESIFTCAWTPGKLCRGYCEFLKITADEMLAIGISDEVKL